MCCSFPMVQEYRSVSWRCPETAATHPSKTRPREFATKPCPIKAQHTHKNKNVREAPTTPRTLRRISELHELSLNRYSRTIASKVQLSNVPAQVKPYKLFADVETPVQTLVRKKTQTRNPSFAETTQFSRVSKLLLSASSIFCPEPRFRITLFALSALPVWKRTR